MKTLKEKIEVMQAALDGKEIEFQDANGDWIGTDQLIWNWGCRDYRIKPEPMEFSINIWENGHCCIQNDKEVAPPGYKTIKVREVMDD